MIYISLKFIAGMIMFVAACFLCTWFNRRLSKKDKYRIIYEYQWFTLATDHNSFLSLYHRRFMETLDGPRR